MADLGTCLVCNEKKELMLGKGDTGCCKGCVPELATVARSQYPDLTEANIIGISEANIIGITEFPKTKTNYMQELMILMEKNFDMNIEAEVRTLRYKMEKDYGLESK